MKTVKKNPATTVITFLKNNFTVIATWVGLLTILSILACVLYCATMKGVNCPTTPETFLKDRPVQKGSFLLFFTAYITNSPDYGVILLPSDLILTKTDPFFFNVCLLYLNVCEICIILALFFLIFSLIGIILLLYSDNKLVPKLKSYLEKKENAFWELCASALLYTLIGKLVINSFFFRFYDCIIAIINLANSDIFPYYYYNPPGLAMGSSRVLHPADYSPIFSYFNLEYINPDYILYVITYVKYLAIYFVVYSVYYIIASITTVVYSTNKTALNLQDGPASLYLFTKCFYFKNHQARINSLLLFVAISFILMFLASVILYHYLAIYHIG